MSVNENPDFELEGKDNLSSLLKRFYADVRNKAGGEYGKKSLISMRASIQRHINQPPYNVNYNIITDPVFIAPNNVLKGHIKVNKAKGLDTSAHYIPITKADKALMYSSGTLSNLNPKSLQHKVYYEMTLHFGRRAREGLHDMCQKDILFRTDSEGAEYACLAYNPLEKNHQNVEQGGPEHDQRMYGTGREDCPLKTMKLYLSKLTPSNPSFFQTPKAKGWKLSSIWFTRSTVGVNTIGKFMVTISELAKLSQIYTNHCIRSTCVTTLREAGIPNHDIQSVTGHRSVASVDAYSKTPDSVRKTMSHTLAGVTTNTTHTESTVVNVKDPKESCIFSNATFHGCTINISYK